MTRMERKRRNNRRKAVLLFFFFLILLLLLAMTTEMGETEDRTDGIEETAAAENIISVDIENDTEEDPVDEYAEDKEALAKMVWGEARGCSETEQAAVVWCALNRYDNNDPYFDDCESIYDIVTQPGQFVGYKTEHPVDPEIMAVVEDVMTRWMEESEGKDDVGRVLPKDYLFFTGNGRENIFRDEYRGGNIWDWSLESPYETEGE